VVLLIIAHVVNTLAALNASKIHNAHGAVDKIKLAFQLPKQLLAQCHNTLAHVLITKNVDLAYKMLVALGAN